MAEMYDIFGRVIKVGDSVVWTNTEISGTGNTKRKIIGLPGTVTEITITRIDIQWAQPHYSYTSASYSRPTVAATVAVITSNGEVTSDGTLLLLTAEREEDEG